MKKAQSAMEFVLLTGAVFFFFVSFVGLIYVSIEKKNYEKKDIALGIQAEYLADEIALAYEAGDGYERTFTFPNTILGKSYTIEIIEGDSIYVYTSDNKHAMSISSLKASYHPTGAEDKYSLDIDGPNYINNTKGEVWIK